MDDGFRNVYVYGGYRDLIRPVTVLRPIDAALDPAKQAGFTWLGFACADGSNSRLSDSGPGGQHAPQSKAPSIDTRWSSFRNSGLAVTLALPWAPSLPGRSAPSSETRTGRAACTVLSGPRRCYPASPTTYGYTVATVWRAAVRGVLRVRLRVEPGRREVLRAVERELAVPAEVAGRGRQSLGFACQLRRQAILLCEQHVRNVVDPAGRVDTAPAQQALESQLQSLLRLSHDIRPALPLEQHVQGLEPEFRAPDIVPSASSTLRINRPEPQYGCPWRRRREIRPAEIMRRISASRSDTDQPRSWRTSPSVATSAQVPEGTAPLGGRWTK